MNENPLRNPEVPFRTSKEEREHLQKEMVEREKAYAEGSPEHTHVADDVIRQYKEADPESVLSPQFRESEAGVEKIALDLSPEEHDDQMAEFMEIVQEKGVKNAMAVIDKMNNPHLADDFHRFLIEYVRSGGDLKGLRPKKQLSRALHHTLYEIILPREYGQENGSAPLKEILSSMEQFFSGMRSIEGTDEGQPYYSIELALPEASSQYSFYVSIPRGKKELFEKQIRAVYSEVQLREQHDDYNIFNYDGIAVGSTAISKGCSLFPIRTYDSFDHDPLNVLLNSFTNVDRDGEGAAIQIVISARNAKRYRSMAEEVVKRLRKGESLSDAMRDVNSSIAGSLARDLAGELWSYFTTSSPPKPENEKEKQIDQASIDLIEQKLSNPFFFANVRLVASSRTEHEADSILSDMEAAFNQFESGKGNSLSFRRMKRGRLQKFLKNYSYRYFDPGYSIPLNTAELTTLIHFETLGIKGSNQLKETKGVSVPVPAELPQEGVLLGVNKHHSQEQKVYMPDEDRLRHFYVIGQTGTGKTTLLKNMMIQDIENGHGLCFIDPHGADVQDVLANIPRERAEDVIYFDPSHTEDPMGLNMLEYDPERPEQKTFVVNELFKIFQRLYANTPESMGPMFEQYFRNAAMLVVEDPESGNTLLDISRVLTNSDYRDLKLSRCNNPVITQFWEEVADKAGGESSLQNIVPYITSKFDVFMTNEIMRPIIAQEHSSFNFREVMDQKKILLVNLSKGTLGDINANLLGLIIVGKILMATLSRVDMHGKGDIEPYYLYIDEFQNVTTDSISTILSEARKYKLGLNIAHQFIAQLDEGIKNAVFGNVGSMASFRVGSDDAEFLEHQFKPTVTAQDLMNVENRNAYIRMLVGGEPVKPFSLATVPPKEGNYELAEKLKKLSYLTYGEDRSVVEKRIQDRYRK